MYAISPNLGRRTYVRVTPDNNFRITLPILGKSRTSLVFLSGNLYNAIHEKTVITIPLTSGTYKFKVKGYDNLDNENTGTQVTVVLSNIPYWPENVSALATGNDVTVSWSVPVGGSTPTSYKIYSNNGVSGGPIDRTAPLAVATAIERSKVVTVADGDWLFCVETVSGAMESVNYWCPKLTIPSANEDGGIPGNMDDGEFQKNATVNMVNIKLANASLGKLKLSFVWTMGSKASYFRIYHDDGTGTIDWNNNAFRFARSNGLKQEYTTAQICFVANKVYKVGLRAENPSGTISENFIEYNVTLDGIAPEEVTNLNGEII